MKTNLAFYSVAKRTIIDLVVLVKDQQLGMFSSRNEEELRSDFADVVCAEYEVAQRAIEDSFVSLVSESTEEAFWENLGAVPPLCRNSMGNTESFKMSEMRFGNVTLICCRIGDRYFEFHDKATLKHQEIVDKVKAHLSTERQTADA